jgi:hypothetical protein
MAGAVAWSALKLVLFAVVAAVSDLARGNGLEGQGVRPVEDARPQDAQLVMRR